MQIEIMIICCGFFSSALLSSLEIIELFRQRSGCRAAIKLVRCDVMMMSYVFCYVFFDIFVDLVRRNLTFCEFVVDNRLYCSRSMALHEK